MIVSHYKTRIGLVTWLMTNLETIYVLCHIVQMYSGITHGRVLNEELYAQRFQKLIYPHLFTDCFMKISAQSSEQIQFCICICCSVFVFVLTIKEISL